MGIMDYLKQKKKSTMTPIDILREKAELPKKEECNCVFCQNSDDIKNIKLVFVQLEDYTHEPSNTKMIKGIVNQSPVYKIPQGMTLEEATRVLSYVNELIESNFEIDYDSMECQKLVQKYLPNYGFEIATKETEEMQKQRLNDINEISYHHGSNSSQQEYKYNKDDMSTQITKVDDGSSMHIVLNEVPNTADLFVVSGNWNEFKHSDAYPKYASWFTPLIETGEMQDLYERLNIKFPKAPMPNSSTMSM